jgi:hypothetical protein
MAKGGWQVGIRTGAAAVALAAAALVPAAAWAGDSTFQYEVGPVPIPDGHGSAKLSFHFIAPPTANITAVRPNFRVRHRQTHQLELFVKGPDGTKRRLSDHQTHGRNLGEDACGADPNGLSFTGFWSDPLADPLDAGSAPYSGYYLPDQSLTVFNGDTFAGTWKIIVKDTRAGRHGKLLCGLMSIFYTT